MEAHDLECVTALSHAGHLGRAAGALGISRSSLMARVLALEIAVGEELFTRSARGVHATTTAGATFIAYAHRALDEIAAAALDADPAARR